jgi:N-methylhydantoinase A/oxoprolinase/acetone carboxylase beta subunit
MSYRLGIDTGGTYTDAVLVNEQNDIVAAFKSLTTRHELTLGIGNALAGLPAEQLQQVNLVSLSTTLTTNSVVEGRGAPVCALLPGYNPTHIEKSGLLDILGEEHVITLAGGHNAMGNEREPLDLESARQAILDNRDRVSAFAISGMFGVRNNSHEQQLRQLVKELSGKPAACGHELASSLGAPRRALTVVLNARMIPYIEHLILSVKQILSDLEINATLMMVKGDGSLVNTETALQQPVGTVLSGPAASVIGACTLSGVRNAIVADMGGTTTDIAIVTNGQPELSEDGAKVGDWQPMIEAVRVYSVGLGGDSDVRFRTGEGLAIGPRRVVPLSLLAHQYPQVLPYLRQQLEASPNARNNRFALRLESNQALMSQLSPAEKEAWDALEKEPIELEWAVNHNRSLARSLARLERMGLVIFSGFTPSDAAHVLGFCHHWCNEAAELAALIWVQQMRRVYGFGRWERGDAITPCRQVIEQITQITCQKLIEAGLHQHGRLNDANTLRLTELLTGLILGDKRFSAENPLFKLNFAPDYPVVAVGAPASSFYPGVAEQLNLELIIPPYAEVANAVGAVMGAVVQRAHITITQPLHGQFRLFRKEGPQDFSSLAEAIACAEELAQNEALQLAEQAGATAIKIQLSRENNEVDHDIDGYLFLDTRITATASGRPSCRLLDLSATAIDAQETDVEAISTADANTAAQNTLAAHSSYPG